MKNSLKTRISRVLFAAAHADLAAGLETWHAAVAERDFRHAAVIKTHVARARARILF